MLFVVKYCPRAKIICFVHINVYVPQQQFDINGINTTTFKDYAVGRNSLV